MGRADRRARMGLIGVAAAVLLAAATGPALAQTSSPSETEPTQVVDVDDFADRAQQWSEARRRAREEALRKAEELANRARSSTTTTAPPTTTAAPTITTTAPPTTTAAPTITTTAPPTTTVAPTTTETAAIEHPIPAGTTEEQWQALRQCESTQNYRAISVSGRYRGAYQFSIRTWNWVSEMHYPELAGVDPIDASPPDQDKMAYKLYEINGWDPWPTCKKRLPS